LILPEPGIRPSRRGYTGATGKVETLKVAAMTRIVPPIALALAAAATMLCAGLPAARAQYYGDAPWCAVMELGEGDVQWDCEYNSVEACVPNVLAGNRGFCELNPYGSNARQGSAPVTHRARHLRHQTHKYSHAR
jgi:hypothetical protein